MAEHNRRDGERQNRLDQPRDRRRAWRPRSDFDTERFGRFAESFARFMGTATFLAGMTVFIAVWLTWNSPLGPQGLQWDPYPFIFLTLILSLQASYAAPLILLAQNRQEARDRVQQQQDRDADAQSHADMEFLAREVASLRLGLGEVATRDFLRSELRGLIEALDPSEEGERRDKSGKPKKDKRDRPAPPAGGPTDD
jgi:uncharacterized membrane protein